MPLPRVAADTPCSHARAWRCKLQDQAFFWFGDRIDDQFIGAEWQVGSVVKRCKCSLWRRVSRDVLTNPASLQLATLPHSTTHTYGCKVPSSAHCTQMRPLRAHPLNLIKVLSTE